MQHVKYGEVRLSDGLFKERETLNRAYLMELDTRALLQNFYAEAGIVLPALQIVEDPAESYLHWGWEAPTCQLRGHFLGHYMSAAAHLAATNQDIELKAKLEVILGELEKCQKLNGGKWIGSIPEKFFYKLEKGDYIWSPQYTLHKTLMGLLDTYLCLGNQKALALLENAALWYLEWAEHLAGKEEIMLKGEAGGMLEIWAKLYQLTGKKEYAFLAKCYSSYGNFARLRAGEDALTDNHANASIPEAHGACMMYEATGDEAWLMLAKRFWENATKDRAAYATLGANAGEFWIAPGKLYEAMGDRNQEFCTMYNMVRLADYLYCFTGEKEYADYIEKALYNAFLAQQNKRTAMPTYFLPQKGGSYKKWGTKRHDFWCCYGTMVQAQTIYPELCYYVNQEKEEIVVNQFIPSEAVCQVGKQKVQLVQEVDMKYCAGALFGEEASSQKSRWMMRLQVTSEAELTLRIRIPAWATKMYVGTELVFANGAPTSDTVKVEAGYIVLQRHFAGEELQLLMVPELSEQPLGEESHLTAIVEGPIVLAALGEEGKAFSLCGKKAKEMLKPFVEHSYETYPWVQSSYRAQSAQGEVSFVPLYEVVDEMYTLYVREDI